MITNPVPQPADDAAVLRSPNDYEAPRIETVLTPEELAREVLYAGTITKDGDAH